MNGEENSQSYDLEPKIVIVGEVGVGKTSLYNKFIEGITVTNPKPTIGVEYRSKAMVIQHQGRDYSVKAKIWDTAGQERYRSVTSVQLRKALGALIIYDITNKKSFEKVFDYINELPLLTKTNPCIKIIGNKLDLVLENPSKREVSQEMVDELAKKCNLKYYETSALFDQKRVEAPFQDLIKEVVQKDAERDPEQVIMESQNAGIELKATRKEAKNATHGEEEEKKGCC